MGERVRDFAEEVRIAKLKLNGLNDSVIAELLPGAPRIAREVTALLNDLVAIVQRVADAP